MACVLPLSGAAIPADYPVEARPVTCPYCAPPRERCVRLRESTPAYLIAMSQNDIELEKREFAQIQRAGERKETDVQSL